MSKETVGVILAGGKSRRMGTNKAFLEIGGIPLVQRSLEILRPLFPKVAIVSKDPEKFHFLEKVDVVQDLFQEHHALGGIYTVLTHYFGKSVFVFACDLPFLNPILIRSMAEKVHGYDLLVPKTHQGLEPLHALYTQKCLGVMKGEIQAKRWRLEDFIRKTHFGIVDNDIIHTLDPSEFSFFNVNTPEDIQEARMRAASRSGGVECL